MDNLGTLEKVKVKGVVVNLGVTGIWGASNSYVLKNVLKSL